MNPKPGRLVVGRVGWPGWARQRSGLGLGVVALLLLVVTAGCREGGKANLVVVGDSLSAGHQNSCLLASQQVHGYAQVLANQARVKLVQPLIAEPGAPPCLDIFETGNPLSIRPVAGSMGERVDPTVQPTNLAVPGARTLDVLNAEPDTGFFGLIGYPFADLHRLVLNTPAKSPPQSMLAQAQALLTASDEDHDVAIFWIGNNDALWAAIAGDTRLLTPEVYFQWAYDTVLSGLAATGADLVLANIPDVTVIPHLWPAERAVGLFGADLAQVGPLLGIAPGDYVTMSGLADVYAVLTGQVPGPLPGNAVADAAEIATIQQAIAGFNAFIAYEAQAYGAALADINGLLNDVHASGYAVGGRTLTTDFCGGVFSLDGIHPTNTGYAITANTFIEAINARFGAHIPRANVASVLAAEPAKHACIAAQ